MRTYQLTFNMPSKEATIRLHKDIEKSGADKNNFKVISGKNLNVPNTNIILAFISTEDIEEWKAAFKQTISYNYVVINVSF